jgi:DNA-binding transcriptional ArsR family regulator
LAILKTKGKTTTRRRRRGDMIKETLRFLSVFFGDPEPKTVKEIAEFTGLELRQVYRGVHATEECEVVEMVKESSRPRRYRIVTLRRGKVRRRGIKRLAK